MEDIRQALLFLQENAHQIGFDPSRITLAGHSAGASILSALSVSPKSRGLLFDPLYSFFSFANLDLFSQAIQFSGSSFSLISTGNLVEKETQKIVNRLNAGGTSVPNPKEFLKQFSTEDILKAYKQIVSTRRNLMFQPHHVFRVHRWTEQV